MAATPDKSLGTPFGGARPEDRIPSAAAAPTDDASADMMREFEQLRESLSSLLGGSDGLWAACIRAAILLGETPKERGELLGNLQSESPPPDIVRRALVEVVMHGDRRTLLQTLDESILGLRARPTGYFALRAAS